jgi:hypothetical protein
MKTFQDGAAFGAGAKAATGLVRLPNVGAVHARRGEGHRTPARPRRRPSEYVGLQHNLDTIRWIAGYPFEVLA